MYLVSTARLLGMMVHIISIVLCLKH